MEIANLIISSIEAIAIIVMILYLKKTSEIQSKLIENQSTIVKSAQRFIDMVPIELLEKLIPHAEKIARTEERDKYLAEINKLIKEREEQFQRIVSNFKLMQSIEEKIEEKIEDIEERINKNESPGE